MQEPIESSSAAQQDNRLTAPQEAPERGKDRGGSDADRRRRHLEEENKGSAPTDRAKPRPTPNVSVPDDNGFADLLGNDGEDDIKNHRRSRK